MFFSSILPFFALVCTCHAIFGAQSITVTGRLYCNGQPAGGVLVEMLEDGNIFDRNRYVRTNNDGTFSVKGRYYRTFTDDPQLTVRNTCNNNDNCVNQYKINIFQYSTSSGSGNNYDIGTINLDNQSTERRPGCIN